MTWYDDERSVQDSRPRELYVFATPTATTRIASFPVDVVYSGNTYTSVPTSRSSLQSLDCSKEQNDFTVELPATHPLPQSYASYVPPRELMCTVLRYQAVSGVALAIGSGYVTALAFKERMASFRIPGASDAFAVQIPSASCTRICNHVLYDARCGLSRATYELAVTISTIASDRKSITVSTVGAAPNNYYQFGELVHAASSERRMITSQVGTTISFSYRLPLSIVVGNALSLFPGCDHSVRTCRDKFANVNAFGGFPLLPNANPFWVDMRMMGRRI